MKFVVYDIPIVKRKKNVEWMGKNDDVKVKWYKIGINLKLVEEFSNNEVFDFQVINF